MDTNKPNLTTLLRVAGIFLVLLVGVFSLAQDVEIVGPTNLDVGVCGNGEFTITISTTTAVTGIVVEAWVAENRSNDDVLAPDFTFVEATGTADTSFKIAWPEFDQSSTDPDWVNSITVSPTCDALSNRVLVVDVTYDDAANPGSTITERYYSGSINVLMPNLVVELSPEVITGLAPGGTANWEVWVSNTGLGVLSGAEVAAALPAVPYDGGIDTLTFTPAIGIPPGLPIQVPDLDPDEKILLGVVSGHVTAGTTKSCENIYVEFTGTFGCEGDCPLPVEVTGSVALEYRTPNLTYTFDPATIDTIPYCGGTEVTVTVENPGAAAGNIVGLEMTVDDAHGMAYTMIGDSSAEIDVVFDAGTNTFQFFDAADPTHNTVAIIGPEDSVDFTFNVSRNDCAVVHCRSLIFMPHFYDDCGDEFTPPIQELKIESFPPASSDYDITVSNTGNPSIPNEGATLVYGIEALYNAQAGETGATADIVVTFPAGFTVSAPGTTTGYTTDVNSITWPSEAFNSGNGWEVNKTVTLTAHYGGHDCDESYTVRFDVNPLSSMCLSRCDPDGATTTLSLLSNTLVYVAKSATGGADGNVYAGDPLIYTVGVSYYGPLFDLGSGSSVDTPPAYVTDTIPAGMVYVAGTAYVDGVLSEPTVSGDGTVATPYVLTWCLEENTLVQGGAVPVTYAITPITDTLAPGYDAARCLCGTTIENTATATLDTSTSAPCAPADVFPFTCDGAASLALAYNCEDDTGFTAEKVAVPDTAERCDYEPGHGITFTNTIRLAKEITDWNDVTFTENGSGAAVVFLSGGLSGTADFYLNGVLVADDQPITIGVPLSLGAGGVGLTPPGTPGVTDELVIVYELFFTSAAGTTAFVDWSDITVAGTTPNPNCPAPVGHFGDWVTPVEPTPTVTISEFCHYDLADNQCTYVVNRCDVATFRVYLDSTRPEYNVSVVVDLSDNYTYPTTDNETVYTNITRIDGTPLPAYATVPGDGTIVFNLGNLNTMPPGTDHYIQFNLTTDCEGETGVSATVNAKGRCLTNTYARTQTYEASRGEREPGLLIKKTPDVIFVKDRGTQLPWTIYVTNPGSGPATNVIVTDTLGGGISYVSSEIDGTPVTGSFPYTLDTPTIITWNIPSIAPGHTAVITMTGQLETCADRDNYVEATWGCPNEDVIPATLYCGKITGPTVAVQDLNTRVIITSHEADDINTCGGTSYVTVKFRNIGKAYAYNMVMTEDLPDGVLATGEWSITVNDAFNTDISSHFTPGGFSTGVLTWTADDVISMKPVDDDGPGDEFTLIFGVRINGCGYLTGDKTMTADLDYATPCTTSESPAQDGVSTVSAPVLTVDKSPDDVAGDPSDPITWNISIHNPSEYTAKSVILWDVPPPIFSSVALFPSMPGKGVSEAEPWFLGDIDPGETLEFSAMGTLKGCGDGSTGINTAWVEWCDSCKTSASSNVSSIFTIPNIALDVETDLDYCGGEVSIELVNGGSRAYNVVLTDTLPDGFKYSSVTSATITSNVTGRTFSVTAPDITGDGTSGNPFILTWDSGNFGTYIEKFETLTITFYLENEIGSGAVPCATSFGPSNNVYVTYDDDCGDNHNASSTDAISIPTVPDLDVTKVLTGPEVIGEEDEGIWHVTITSNGGAATGTITIVDTFGTGWNVSDSTVTAPATISGTGTRTIVGDPVNGGGTVTWSGVSLDADETFEFDISVQAKSTGPEAQLTNEITVTGACIGGCTYSSATATSVTIPGHTEITKVITDNTPADSTTTATIGETVQVRIRAEYYGSSTNYTGVTVWDTPPTGLILGTPTVTYGGAVPSVTPSGTPMLWNVADFIGYGWVQIDYSATVDNNTDIGTDTGETSVLPNTAYTHYTTGTGTYTDSASASVTVLEPRLILEKNDNVGAVVSAGDDIHYTVSVHHPSTSVPGDTTAHDIIVTDTVPVELVMPSSVTVSTGSTSIVGRVITWTIPSLATTDPIATLQYDATVIDTVEPGDAFKNTATLTWTSLAGSVPGERIGTGGLEYNDYHAETEIPLTVDNSADITKTRDKAIATIGETVTYTITVDLPIAQIPSLSIEDTLHAGYDYTEGETTITLPDGTTITGAAADPTGTNPYTWSFTNIAVDAGHTADDLVITFEAVVTNIAGNQGEAPATTLTNSVTATSAKLVFVGSPTPGVDSATAPIVTVVEPRLTIVKTHARISGPTPTTSYQVGTVVEYTLTITNTGGCTAYDVNVRDTFDTRFINPVYNPASAPAGVTYGTPGNPMTWTVASIAGNGGSIALRYRVTIGNTADVNPGDILNNTAETIWQSLPDSFTEHRYGTYGAVPADLNNYYATDDDSITIYDTARVYKCFEGQAYNANTNINVTVGSPASYTITVTLPRATIPDLTITDTLPVGVRYVAGSAVINAPYGTNSPYAPLNPEPTLSPATPNDGTVATTLTWDYDNVNATAGTWLTITFDVVVTNHLINQNTRSIGNTVIATGTTLDFSSAAGYQRTGSDASGNMNVREPVLTLTKEDVYGTGNLYEAGKVIQYRLTLTNTGTSTAYDINIEDTLPAEFISPAYIPALAPSGVTYGAAGSPMTWTINSLAAGATMTLEYRITIADGVIAGTTYTNTARMIWQSLDDSFSDHRYGIYDTPGGLNDYFTSDTYPITIDDSATITKTRDKDEATIGETVTYTITVDLPMAQIPSLSIADTLDAGYDYVEGETTITLPDGTTITGGSADPSGTNPYTWSFTNIEPDPGHTVDDVVITFEAVVLNIMGNQAGNTLTNVATATAATLVFAGGTTATAPVVTVIEPVLEIEKNDDDADSIVEAGQPIHYTVSVHHPALSVPNDTTAYDIIVTDTVPVELVMPLEAALVVSVGSATISGRVITWTIPSLTTGASTATLEYDTTVVDTVEPGDVFKNEAALTWTSLHDSTPGEYPERRIGTGALPQNDYHDNTDLTLTVDNSADLTKTRDKANATIGETVTYTIAVDLPMAQIPSLSISDVLDAGYDYVEGETTITLPNGTTITGGSADPSGTNPYTWSFTNIAVDAGHTDDDLVITFEAVVRNVMGNQDTVDLANSVTATAATLAFVGSPTPGAETVSAELVNIVEPVLTLTKSHVLGSGTLYESGRVVRYTLTLTNEGTSTAYDINIEDTLPAQFISPMYISGDDDSHNFTGNPLTWHINSLAVDATATLVYEITIADGAIAGAEYTNTAVTVWQSLEDTYPQRRDGTDGVGGLNDYTTSDTNSITIDNSADLTKTRDKANATIGETVTYTITVDLPMAQIPSLLISDVLDAGYDYVEGETTITLPNGTTITGGSADPSGTNPYTWSFTNIAVDAGHTDDDLVITFEAVVRNIMGNQDTVDLANSVTATAATLAFVGSPTPGAETVSAELVNIVEPVLTLTKSHVLGSGTLYESGRVVRYTLTLTNEGTSTAYDIDIEDTLPAQFISPMYISGDDDSHNFTGNPLTWHINSLAVDATATLVYEITIADGAIAGAEYTNTAVTVWQSLEDTYPQRRDGTDGVGGLNDYTTSDTNSITIDNSADLTKTRDKANATIGETVTYTIAVDLPMAQIPSLSISDVLDAGYDYVEGETTITLPNGTTITGGSADPSGTNPYTWSFTNIAVDAGHTDDDLVITFEAVVRNVMGNQDTVDLANSVTATAATLAFVGSPTPGAETVSAELVNIVEPVLTLTKSHVLGSGTLYESGRVVRYTLTLTNEGTSTAYDINIEDTLPAQFISPMYISGDDDSHNFTGNPLTWHINSLAVDATATLVYEITIADGAIAGAEYTNTAVTVWQSLEDTYPQRRDGTDGVGGLNDYTTSDTNSITIDNSADIQKTTDNERDVTIGLTVPYTITVDLPMAEVEALTVTDALEPGLAYVPNTAAAPLSTTITLPNGTVISGTAANPSSTAPLTWSFTDIAVDPGHTDDDVVITFHVLVTTDAVNVDLRHIPNEATATSVNLDFDSGTSGNQNTETDSSGDLIVHVPAFTIDKAIASIAYCDSTGHTTDFVEPGDIVTYTITVHNVGSAGGTAFGVMVQDDLPPEFEYIAGTTVISTGATTDPDTSVAHRCVWSVGDMAGATDLTITFNARVTSDIDKTIERYRNSAYVWGYYDTAHALGIEADNHERVGADDNATDTAFADITGTRLPEIAVEKSVLSVSGPNAETVQPGDWATYRIVVTNLGDGAAYDIDVTDVLPVGLVYANIGSTTAADWTGGYAGSHTHGPTGTITGDPAGVTGTITWDGADILGDPRGIVLTPGAVLTLDYRVYVTEDIIQGEDLVNNATVYGGDCNGARTLMVTDDSTIHTHEPFFVTDKTITQIDGDPTNITVAVVGSIIDYSYTVTNVGLGDANTIIIYDTLPIGFVYVPGSANIGEPTTISADGRDLTWETGDSIASGATYTVTFQAEVTDGTSGGTMYNLMWVTGLDGSGHAVVRDGSLIIPADTDADDTDEVPVEVDIPNKPLILNKDVTPRAVDPGAVVHYTVTFTNKRKISFYESTITDTMPHGFSYLPGTTLVNGVPAADPTGDNPYVFTIGTIGPESTTRLDYYVLVSHAARHGANVNVAVLNAHDGAGKPISLTDRATVTVKGGGFFDFDIPIPPRKTRPGVIPERPLPPREEEERPCPECCIRVALVPIRSQAFGDTLPGQPEIYYQTDIAMYAATELLVTERRLTPWLEVQGFDPEREYLMTGLYNRMITKLGEYAQYNLGNVVMESMLGIPLDYAPGILETAKRDRIAPERAGENLIAGLAKRAGLSQAPEIQPIFLEYFGSYPYLHDRIAKDELAWEDNLMDKNIMPAALGFTLLREANQIETFLASADPTERFFGLLLLTQAVEKTASISTDLAKTAEFSPPVKYLPHFSRIEVDKGRPGLVWRTTDETSTLYDHVSVLWGLSKLRSVALHSADPDVRALLPQITERMDEVYNAIEVIHYNQKDKTFISVHAPGAAEAENKIAAKDLAFTILALRSVLFDNRDLSLNTIDPERKIIEIADFMIEKLMGDDGGIYTAYNYADGTPVVGVKRTLVDNSLAIRALLSAYVVTEDRKYRKAALDVYAFMVKELWREDLMIFIDEEDPDYEVVLTPQSIGALIGALRDLVLYGEPDMRHDYLDRMSYTTDRILDQSQLQLYENRFFPWHAPITIVPEDPNGRSYIKPIIATMRDKGISHDLAPILVRKMVLNITPAGAIASGKEDPVSDWKNWPADLRYEVPDVIASSLIDDTFVTDEGMYFTTLTRDYRMNLNKDLPAFNPYNTDPGIQVYAAFVGEEVSRYNVENLTLNSEMGIGLSKSEMVRTLAEKAGKSPEKYLTEFVQKRVPKEAAATGIFDRFIDSVKGAVGLDRSGRFADIIFLEYASGKPFYTEDISDGWNEETFDKKLTVSSMSSTMVRQLLVILDNSRRNDLTTSERFVDDVMTLSVAAKRVALDEIISKAEKGGVTGAPHSFKMVADEKKKRDVIEIIDKKSSLFDDTFAVWAMALFIDARRQGLFDAYRGVMGDPSNDQETLSGLIDALIAHHYSAEYGTLVTGSVNTVDVSKALDMLTRAVEVMDDGPAKDTLTGLIKKQADFIMTRLPNDTGFAPMVGLGNETIAADLCEMETLGTNVFPILALVRTSEVTGDEKYLRAALTFFDRFDQSKWDQAIGLYLSSGTIYKATDRSRLELKYNNQELIAAVLLISKLQPHLAGERKILSAYHMTTFMNRIMEIASVERYPGNGDPTGTIFSPEIIRSVKIILDESKGVGKPGDVFTNRIVIDNDCYDQFCNDQIDRAPSRIRIEETLPDGFHYVPGSTRFNGAPGSEPIGTKTLNWYYPALSGGNRLIIDYQVVADPGISEGSYTTSLNVSGFSGYGGRDTICDVRGITATTVIRKDLFAEDVEKSCVPCNIGRRALSR